MRVKICGITRRVDLETALESGADALGFVVASPLSPRNLSYDRARELMRFVPVFITKVAVTSTGNHKTIQKICSKVKPDALQLHKYNQEITRIIKRRFPEINLIVAKSIGERTSIRMPKSLLAYADAVIADTPSHTGMGGTGTTHDWKIARELKTKIHPRPLILAGGLNPRNVKQAIKQVKPYAVDVSTGVESRPGIKDPVKIRQFISQARESAL